MQNDESVREDGRSNEIRASLGRQPRETFKKMHYSGKAVSA